MDMPKVDACSVDSCAYNQEQACHALAITVGDMRHAHCDTFFRSATKGGATSAMGKVGACKMSDCTHNVDFECQAPAITVGQQADAVDCLTFQAR